jgi:hypothetical protein
VNKRTWGAAHHPHAATMLSQIDYLSLPPELIEKLYYGDTLTSEAQTLASAVLPRVYPRQTNVRSRKTLVAL